MSWCQSSDQGSKHAELWEGLITYLVGAAINSDWLEAVEASYVPVQVCDNLWIIPTKHQVQDASACNILMRPGMAFGTGEHAQCSVLLHLSPTFSLEASNQSYRIAWQCIITCLRSSVSICMHQKLLNSFAFPMTAIELAG